VSYYRAASEDKNTGGNYGNNPGPGHNGDDRDDNADKPNF
jgi:hypothetical protein